MMELHKVSNFLHNLIAVFRQKPGLQKKSGPGHGKRRAPFVHDAAVFFLDFQKYRTVVGDSAVTADTKLFFVFGFFNRIPDQVIVRSIIINVMYGVKAVLVLLDPGLDSM